MFSYQIWCEVSMTKNKQGVRQIYLHIEWLVMWRTLLPFDVSTDLLIIMTVDWSCFVTTISYFSSLQFISKSLSLFLQSGVPIENCIAVTRTISSVSMTHLLLHLHPRTDHQWDHLTFCRLPQPGAQSFSLALRLPRCRIVQWYLPKSRTSYLHPWWSHGSKLNHHLQPMQLNLKSKPLSVIYCIVWSFIHLHQPLSSSNQMNQR